MTATAPTTEKMVFPAHAAPIGIFFIVVPTLVILATAACLLLQRLPFFLIMPMLAVAVSCMVLVKEAIEEMGQVTLEWSGQGLTVHRVLGSVSYYWSHVEAVESFDPGATFGDLGRHEEGRTAIGLFIRNPMRKERPIGAPPDVMLVSRTGEDGDRLPKLAERLGFVRRYGGGKEARRLGGAAGEAPAKPKTKAARSFRRTAA